MIDSRELVAVLWGRRWLIMATTVFCAAAFATIALLSTPIYRATVILAATNTSSNSISSALGSVGGLAALAGLNLSADDSATEETLAVFRSRQFTESFINDRHLVPEFFSKLWDAAAGKWTVPSDQQPTLNNAFGVLDSIRTITRSSKTGLITLQIDWKDRYEAASWANDLVARLNAEMRDRAIAKADASLGYLEQELAATTDIGTRDAINRLMEEQIKQRMLAHVTQEYALRVVDNALVPDASSPVRPRKLLLVAAGIFLGGVLGVIIALFLYMCSLAKGRGQNRVNPQLV